MYCFGLAKFATSSRVRLYILMVIPDVIFTFIYRVLVAAVVVEQNFFLVDGPRNIKYSVSKLLKHIHPEWNGMMIILITK